MKYQIYAVHPYRVIPADTLLQIKGDIRYLRGKNRQVGSERDELAAALTELRVQVLSGMTEEQLKALVSNVQVCSLWKEIQQLKEQLREVA